MKRILFSAVIIMFFAACGGDDGLTPTPQKPPTQEETPEVKAADIMKYFALNNQLGLSGPRLERRLPGFLTVDEVFALLEAPGPEDSSFRRDRAIMEMLYATGIRVSELTGSNLPDYDLAAEMVLVRGKGNKERLAPFGSAAKEEGRLFCFLKPMQNQTTFLNS